ncbi:MAG: 50S ribosomal protein L2 [Patescibacteria group bacterium]
MPLKRYKPTTSGRRHASVVDRRELSHKRPEKALITTWRQQAGRNAQGKITVRHRGGGHARFIRIIDSTRSRFEAPATVQALEYDPNRSAWLALVQYADGTKAYVIAPAGMKVGEQIVSTKNEAEIKVGNRLPLKRIPVGIMVHDLELYPSSRATAVKAAGTGAIIRSVEGGFAQLKLPSGEIRKFDERCMATIGQVSNVDHENQRFGKAGRMRWRGIRPSVRGKAMNPVGHPHGGGEGHNPIGLKHPKTPWGKPALGVKTRRAHRYSDQLIVQRRP